jgi:hypothetical protein
MWLRTAAARRARMYEESNGDIYTETKYVGKA